MEKAYVMNVYSGEVKELTDEELNNPEKTRKEIDGEMLIAGDTIYITSLPKKTHKVCHGRGYTGWTKNKYGEKVVYPCTCIGRMHFDHAGKLKKETKKDEEIKKESEAAEEKTE